jgi:hypothetical protein
MSVHITFTNVLLNYPRYPELHIDRQLMKPLQNTEMAYSNKYSDFYTDRTQQTVQIEDSSPTTTA